MSRRLCAGLALLIFVAGCDGRQASLARVQPAHNVGLQLEHNQQQACVADYHASVDYFPEHVRFNWSDQLSVEYGLNFKRLRFHSSVNAGEPLEILLVQCGTPTPAHSPSTLVVQVPIQRLATGNSAMLGAADELGIVDRLVGIENIRAPTVESVRKRIASGHIQELWGNAHSNIEPIMAAQPDVYLSFFSAYPQYNIHPQLQLVGVKALPQADHLESHPLGRAEWLKFLALLVNHEAKANRQFASIERDYLNRAALTKDVQLRPLVMVGFPSGRSSFEVFGGLNQRARLIADAGGHFVLDQSREHGSLVQVSFEHIYEKGAAAPFWLGAKPGYASLQQMLATSPQSAWFRAARESRVYAFDQGYTGAWASPYQDQSMTRPHLLLAELIQILHPQLSTSPLPTNVFIRKLP